MKKSGFAKGVFWTLSIGIVFVIILGNIYNLFNSNGILIVLFMIIVAILGAIFTLLYF